LQILEALQVLLVDDPHLGLPLNDALRLLAGAKDRVWQAVWELEEHSRRSPVPRLLR
jgi:hypothetical protein